MSALDRWIDYDLTIVPDDQSAGLIEQPPFPLGAPRAQPLVAPVQLMKLQLHRRKLADAQPGTEARCVTPCPRSGS